MGDLIKDKTVHNGYWYINGVKTGKLTEYNPERIDNTQRVLNLLIEMDEKGKVDVLKLYKEQIIKRFSENDYDKQMLLDYLKKFVGI